MRQITVIGEDSPGQLRRITAALAGEGINIEDFELGSVRDTGVLVLRVDRPDRALDLIRGLGFRAVDQEALVVRIPDEPGAVARVALRFEELALNVRSMHILDRHDGYCIASIVTDDNESAAEALGDILVR